MNLKPIQLSVANAAILGEWQIRLTQFIDTNNRAQLAQTITHLCRTDAEFKKLVEAAVQSGGTFTQEQLTDWAKNNLVKAAELQQQLKQLPYTLAALQLGIECMKATADQTLLTDVEKQQFNSETYWQTVQFETVQQYCNVIIDMS